MTLLSLFVEPWVLDAVVVVLIASLLVAFLAWMGERERERNEREYEDFQRGRGGR